MAPRYDVREVQDRGHYWQVVYDVTHDNGFTTEHGHSIPKETLEWRAAEYDLNPETQFDTILDIVLAEPYIDEQERVGSVPGEELYDAPDIATARARHVSRCARAKLKHRMTTRAKKAAAGKSLGSAALPTDPLDMIRRDAAIDVRVVAIKREHVRRQREDIVERQRDTRDRATRLAEHFGVDLDAVTQGKMNNG